MMSKSSERVETPTNLDILCGRGRAHFQHEGNVRFRMMIAAHLGSYQNAESRFVKTKIIRALTSGILAASGRFLKRSSKSEPWSVMGYEGCLHKVGHALRDACANKVQCVVDTHRLLSQRKPNDESLRQALDVAAGKVSAAQKAVDATASNTSTPSLSKDCYKLAPSCGSTKTAQSPQHHTDACHQSEESTSSFDSCEYIDGSNVDQHEALFSSREVADFQISPMDMRAPLLECVDPNIFNICDGQSFDAGADEEDLEDIEFARMIRRLLEDVTASWPLL